jgi:hypothetical protein
MSLDTMIQYHGWQYLNFPINIGLRLKQDPDYNISVQGHIKGPTESYP